MSESTWNLDPQLARDTVTVGDLPLSRLLLMEDASYPWAILVPRHARAVELIDLAEGDQAQLMREVAAVSTALRAITNCHKLNVAALGNVVAQLHVHVIARFRQDAAWPRPVWGAGARLPYTPVVRDRLIETFRRVISAHLIA
jgi:diadenosine tetraphosphate (Ap4A) HIT family hydrolase